MSYRFKINEPVPDGVRRIADEEIKFATAQLRLQDPEKLEEGIHEARKAIKRLRALLRLVRPELGTCFRKENAALRDIGRGLSDLRDSSIVLETFDALSDSDSDRQKLQSVRDGLQERKKTKEENTDTSRILEKAAEALERVGERVPNWPLESDGFEAIAEGLKGEYLGAHKAMPKALRKDDSLVFHEWRKRAKCQLFHLRLLKNILSKESGERDDKLHKLETALGDDHNLLILRQHLDAHPRAFGGKKKVQESIRLIEAREQKLRNEAQALGEQIYQQKPKEYVEQLREEWNRAHAHPAVVRRAKTARIPSKVKSSAA